LDEGSAEKGLGSLYLPVWSSLRAKLRGNVFSLPADLRATFGNEIAVGDLEPLADRLRRWLYKDFGRIKAKHLEGTDGEVFLQMASYLDLRFKDWRRAAGEPGPTWASPEVLAQVREAVHAEA